MREKCICWRGRDLEFNQKPPLQYYMAYNARKTAIYFLTTFITIGGVFLTIYESDA